MEIVKSTSVLQSVSSKGLAKFWQGHICNEEDKWYLQTSYWQALKGGGTSIVTFSTPYECKPKNVGKSNETNPEIQAYSEFDSMVKKQVEKGYVLEGQVSEVLPLPMLAQKFTERKHTLIYPVWVQPKYNGMRMLYDGKKAWSRTGKLIDPKIIEHLQFDTKGLIIDGELLLPGNVLLQETLRAVKKYKPGVTEQLLYMIYDVVIPDLPFSERWDIVLHLMCDCYGDGGIEYSKNIQYSLTEKAESEEHILAFHKIFTQPSAHGNGYEGIIIRSDGEEGYKIGHRSNQLQKYKTFIDAEFKIINVREGEGSFKGCAIFVCDNGFGETFDCNPEGTIEHKQEFYKNREQLIGKNLTIRYQELSEKKIPLFPIGQNIRDYE